MLYLLFQVVSTVHLDQSIPSQKLCPKDMSASFPSPDDLVKRIKSIADLTASVSNLDRSTPMMTSFKELASQQSLNDSSSVMYTSGCSEKEIEENRRRSRSVASENDPNGK